MSDLVSSPLSHHNLWSGLIGENPESEVGVLGIPFDHGVSYRGGAAAAPAKLRDLTYHLSPCAEEGQPLSLSVRDYGDVAPDPDLHQFFQAVEDQATEVLSHPLSVFLGGDHSVSIPLMRAFDRAVEGDFGVLHVDAHPDLFDVYEGNPVSHACPARRALELPGLDPANLLFVGLCSISPVEWDFLQAHPEITVFSARQCYKQSIEAVAEQVVDILQGLDGVYLTLDIDVLDGAHAPGTGYPEGVGLSTRELLELVRTVMLGVSVRAMDLVEVAPPLDHGDVTSLAALKVVYEAWWAFQQKQAKQ